MFPPLGPSPASQRVQPLEKPDTAELPDDQPRGEEELFQEASMEHFHEMVQESETRASADVPVQDDMDIGELAEGLLKPAQVPLRRQCRLFDFRVSAVTTKQELDVPVAANQDEAEMTLEERSKNPLFWQSPEFTYEEEMEGMNKAMKSMLNFDVFEEFKMSDLTPEQLETVISTCGVKTRKVEGDVWVLPPVEYYPEGGVVWRLKRTFYGLKNAPKLWQPHLAATLESQGLRCMKSDPNLYYSVSRKVYILCYVDNLMIFW